MSSRTCAILIRSGIVTPGTAARLVPDARGKDGARNDRADPASRNSTRSPVTRVPSVPTPGATNGSGFIPSQSPTTLSKRSILRNDLALQMSQKLTLTCLPLASDSWPDVFGMPLIIEECEASNSSSEKQAQPVALWQNLQSLIGI